MWKQNVIRAILNVYLRIFHRYQFHPHPGMPKSGAHVILTSHFSILDTVVLMVADPFKPYGAMVVKEEALKTPIMGTILGWWGAIGVGRNGHDSLAVREMLRRLDRGQGVAIAPEGTRNRTGRLGPMNAVVIRLVLSMACRGIPVFPVVEIGTFEAMPPGSFLPRPGKVDVWTGPTMDFSRWCGKKVTDTQVAEAAAYIRETLSNMLPPERRPIPGSPDVTNALPLAAGSR